MKLITKYKNTSIQVKAALWYTVCSFLQKGISFVVVPIYIRLLNPAEYGEYSVFQSWRDILIIFASLNLYCGVYTKTLVDIKDNRDKYTSSMQGLGTIITLFYFALYILFHNFFNNLLGLDTVTMFALFLYFIVYPAFSFWSTRQRVEYKYKKMVIVTFMCSLLMPVLSIYLLYATHLRAKAVILGYLIVQCIVGLFFYIKQFLKGRCFFDRSYWRYALKFNIPLLPHYLSLIVLGQADRIMIKAYCGNGDAGIYSFAYQIAAILNVLISSINGSRVPWAYEQLRDKVYLKLNKISNTLCILMAGVTLLVIILSPEVIKILATSDYALAVYVIPIVALGVYFTFCYDLFCTIEFYYGATQYVMFASVVGAVLNIILNAISIPIYGYIAAAYTTLVCYIVFMLMHYIFMKKVLKENGIYENIYNVKFISIISIVLMVLCFACMSVYEMDGIRYSIIILLFIGVVIKRKELMRIIKEMKH